MLCNTQNCSLMNNKKSYSLYNNFDIFYYSSVNCNRRIYIYYYNKIYKIIYFLYKKEENVYTYRTSIYILENECIYCILLLFNK